MARFAQTIYGVVAVFIISFSFGFFTKATVLNYNFDTNCNLGDTFETCTNNTWTTNSGTSTRLSLDYYSSPYSFSLHHGTGGSGYHYNTQEISTSSLVSFHVDLKTIGSNYFVFYLSSFPYVGVSGYEIFVNYDSNSHTIKFGTTTVSSDWELIDTFDEYWNELYVLYDSLACKVYINTSVDFVNPTWEYSWSGCDPIRSVSFDEMAGNRYDNFETYYNATTTEGNYSYLPNTPNDIPGTTNYGSGEVSIVELPDEDNLRVQIGSEFFNYITPTLCCYDCNQSCKIRIFYTYPNIGNSVYLLPENSSSLENAVDYVASLPNSDQLIYDLTPTQRNSSSTDNYYIFVYDDVLATSSLYDVQVLWRSQAEVTSATSTENIGFIKKYFGRVFPLSIFYQIKEIFDKYGSETNTTKLNLTFNDFIPSKYSGYTNSSTVLSANLINNNISFWQTKVYPTLQALIWAIAVLIIYLEIKSFGSSDSN